MKRDNLICIGAIAGAYGARGEMRVKSFTAAPEDLGAYGPLFSEDGTRKFTPDNLRLLKKDLLAVRFVEIETREEAAAAKGVRLYVPQERLPAPGADEFYYNDLIGLQAASVDGRPMGEVRAVFDFGAGDLLELWRIPDWKGSLVIPFTKETVPHLDLKKGLITVAPPPGLMESGDDGE